MSEQVRVEAAGGVLAITLARPERRNAMTRAMYAALADALEGAAAHGSLRLVTFRGLGQDFAAGNDLGDFLDGLPADLTDIPVWRMLRALVACPLPLVAAVHGNCVGIGTTMLLHCDLVIAARDARFSMPFVDLGLVPEAASSLLVPRLAGHRRAARYLMLGESFGADEALDFGLVSHVVEPGDLDGALARMVETLLAKPAEALRRTRQLLRHGEQAEVLARMELESVEFAERLKSSEAREAIAAFFARRSRGP